MATRHRISPRPTTHPKKIRRADLVPAFLQVAQAAVERAARQADSDAVVALVVRAQTCLRAAQELAIAEAA